MKVTIKMIKLIGEKMNEQFVDFSFLAKGNHNENYVIEASKRKYVLRIENNPQFKNLRKEYRKLKSLPSGFGPQVYFMDQTRSIIRADYFVEEFISGKHIYQADNKFIQLMARWLKKLHGQKKKCLPYSLVKAVYPYLRNINVNLNVLSPASRLELIDLMDRTQSYCQKNDLLFATRKTASLLHRDLSPDNVLYDGKKIRLLDWEFSDYGFPEWDLIYFMQSFSLSERLRTLFLKTYGYPLTKTAFDKLQVINLLNQCGDIGYSVWRLGLIKSGELKGVKKETVLSRLKLDIRRLKLTMKILEK